MANNPYLTVRSRSEYFTSISTSGLPTFLISVKNMNLLSSSIYKHLKTNLIKYKQSLILWECGSQLISVLSNDFIIVFLQKYGFGWLYRDFFYISEYFWQMTVHYYKNHSKNGKKLLCKIFQLNSHEWNKLHNMYAQVNFIIYTYNV